MSQRLVSLLFASAIFYCCTSPASFGRAGRFGTKGLAINLLHVHPTLMFSIRLEAVVRWILRNFLSKFVLPLTCHLDGYSFLAATKASYPSVIGSSSRGTGRFLREIFDVTV
ncbi:hypothetical protein RHMOL_Rhmol01G0284600 [Rhododendron molle]|uniref:Uncharacterized protein n=1 Tax=Rhododendron molle TaxID=49168 RepID=A0ACC0Q6A4_RHOML|nr:hypothetical protein RHMOL_Rhmol01G0284600 [Rhododendron molle]